MSLVPGAPESNQASPLAAARRVAGLTQEELALRAGLSVRAVSDIERGRIARPHRRSLEALAAALGLDGERSAQFVALYRPGPQGDPAAAPAAGGVPRQLPPDVAAFTGRVADLEALDLLLVAGGAGPATPVLISAIAGTAGVGKTALAVHWAHRALDRFPDGQLYVNLRGYDPGPPVEPAEALAGFLAALGLAAGDVPAGLPERAARYRTLLADRRMLIVLDNARSPDQVRELLPGSRPCCVVVTSRDALSGLVARDGARRIDLDRLPLDEAVTLLRRLIGGRVDDQPAAAAELAESCARLPLALRVAAELANRRPAASLADLVADLGGARTQLDLLDAGGDPHTAVRAVLSWSYRHLPEDAARAFRLLGLHPGRDFDDYATAALVGTADRDARRLLDTLLRAHLIERTAQGRYGMHDLLRSYAVEQGTPEAAGESRAALTRLLDYYLYAASKAMDALVPLERDRRPRVPAAGGPAPSVADPAAARCWLDSELANLSATASYAAGNGWPDHAIRLASTLYRYLDNVGRHAESVTVHAQALRAAQDIGDRLAEAHALSHIGTVLWRQCRYPQSADHHRKALDLLREHGDRLAEADVRGRLGATYLWWGHYEQATDHLRLALALYREHADRAGEARSLLNLGLVSARWGRYAQSAEHLSQALASFCDQGDSTGEAHARHNLGAVYELAGRYHEAAECLQQARTLFEQSGNRRGVAHTLDSLGLVQGRLGNYERAIDYLQQALAVFREVGDPGGGAEALNGLGEVSLACGRAEQALGYHESALAAATEIDDAHGQARAHNGLGCCHRATGDAAPARRHWLAALALFTELGVPEADQVRGELAALDASGASEPGVARPEGRRRPPPSR